MSSDGTVRVDPGPVRRTGVALTSIGSGLDDESETASRSLQEAPSTGWMVFAAADTLRTLWRSHLSSLGATASDYGDRLIRVADSYHDSDAGAAGTLRAVLSRESDPDQRRDDRRW